MSGAPNSYLFESVHDLLVRQAQRHGDAVAIETVATTALSYAGLLARVTSIMQALHSRGIRRGARVAIVLPNGMDLAVSMLSVSSMATAVPLNPTYRRDEYRAYFDEIRVSHLLTLEQFSSEARAVAEERKIPIIELTVNGSISPAADAGAGGARQSPEIELAGAQDIALILLTSGSTGRSKKVPLTHRNICVSVADICRTLELTPADRCLCMWEQFHVGGLVDLLLVPLAGGGSVICAGSFSAPLFYEMLGRKRPTWFQGVPTTLHELAAYARNNKGDPKAAPLRFIRSVASSLSPQLMQEIEDLFGVPVVQTFGMTEAGPLITTNSLPPGKRLPGSVGISCGPRIRIVSPEGIDQPAGSIGEIAIQGDNVISGYEDAPEANARSFRNGWFYTGDTGYLDAEGFLFLTGRLKEMINRGGEKITPQEIDDVLLKHPEIAQAASFSIKHRTLGEDVAAAVVLRSPNAVSESDIRGFVMRHLADFKVPKMVLFLDQMPRDPIGKISRMSLAVLAEAQRGTSFAGADETIGDSTAQTPPARAASANKMTGLLLPIWQTVLEKPDLGLDDDFFLSGGESLAAVTLFTQMEQAIGPMPPLSSLLLHPTVRRMAARLDQMRSSLDAEPIVSIRTTGSRAPLILCHAANSNVLFARQLLPYLDEQQPFFAIRGRGLEEGETPHTKMEDMAADYIRELKRVRPTGPYIIAGYCAGGYTAYEMARQLREAGEDVQGIILIDPDIHPNTAPWLHWKNPNAQHVLYWRKVLRIWWAAKRYLQIQRRRMSGSHVRRIPFETGLNQSRQIAVFKGFAEALSKYRPQPIDRDIQMLCCAGIRTHLGKQRYGWATLAPRVEFLEVGREHEDVFHDALPTLATALNMVLHRLAAERVTVRTGPEHVLDKMRHSPGPLEHLASRQIATQLVTPAIVPLRATGRRPPFIMCHAAHSNVLFLRRLLPVLDDEQPLLAIRGRGLEEGEVAHREIVSMAADYIKEIKRIRPTGPYILGGACAGGYTAYEIARQLTEAGDKVLGVVLMDPDVHPNTAPWLHWDNPNSVFVRAWSVVLRYWWGARRRLVFLRRRLQKKPRNRSEPFETGIYRQRQAAIRAGLIDALKVYRPRPYDGDVYMLCCARSKAYLKNMKHGWETLARHVEYFVAGEEHEDLFHEALPSLAVALNKALNIMLKEAPVDKAAE